MYKMFQKLSLRNARKLKNAKNWINVVSFQNVHYIRIFLLFWKTSLEFKSLAQYVTYIVYFMYFVEILPCIRHIEATTSNF